MIDCEASTWNEHLLLPEDLYAKALHSTKGLPRKENVILIWFYILKAEGSASDRYDWQLGNLKACVWSTI